MSLLIAFLTFLLVLNCLFLILLVLVQLPKKEAGAGVAFGGGATDALFGAGSGNALTKITKYTAGSFLGLALVLTILNARNHESSSLGIQQALSQKAATTTPPVTPPPAAGQQQPLVPLTTASNPPPAEAAPATNVPALTVQTNLTIPAPLTAPAGNPPLSITAPAGSTNAPK